MTTRVVNLKSETFDIYIGRANRFYGFKESKWRNPFKPKKHTVEEHNRAIELYKKWFWTQPELIAAVPELKGKVLGCWCKPFPCHGDFLAELANKQNPDVVKSSCTGFQFVSDGCKVCILKRTGGKVPNKEQLEHFSYFCNFSIVENERRSR